MRKVFLIAFLLGITILLVIIIGDMFELLSFKVSPSIITIVGMWTILFFGLFLMLKSEQPTPNFEIMQKETLHEKIIERMKDVPGNNGAFKAFIHGIDDIGILHLLLNLARRKLLKKRYSVLTAVDFKDISIEDQTLIARYLNKLYEDKL